MKLYEIDQAIAACLEADADEVVDLDTGEIIALDALKMERNSKLENVACYVKNLVAEADSLKAEKDTLYKREQAARKKADQLKEWLTIQMQGQKLSTSRAAISFRKSESVEVANPSVFITWAQENHKDLLNYKDPEISKTAVKNAINNGEDLPGAKLVTKQNITIK